MNDRTTDDFEIAIERFQEFKRTDSRGSLIQFAQQHKIESLSLIANLVRADIEFRGKSEQLIPVKDYFEAFPSLRSYPQLANSVFRQDFRIRFEAGEYTDFTDYRTGDADLDQLAHPESPCEASSGHPTAEHDRPLHKDDFIGVQVRNYVVDSLISSGRKAVVYKAKDTHLNRWVVLKVSDQVNTTASREAQFLAQLEHPHILPIHEEFEHQKNQFIVTRFVDGYSISDLIEHWHREASHDLPESLTQPGTRCRIAVQLILKVTSAVRHAHNHSVLHCDIKPSNILLERTGIPLLMDFDIAINASSELGTIGGTVGYMSPEHSSFLVRPTDISRRKVDHRSDIYALGIVLFEMLTGQRPSQVDDVTVPLKAVAGTTHALSAIIVKCLDPTPDQRYQSAGELMSDLQNWLDGRALQYAPDNYLPEKAVRLFKRHPVVLTFIGIVSIIVMFSTVQSWSKVRTSHSRLLRLESQLESGQSLDTQSIANTILETKADLASNHAMDFLFRASRRNADQRLQFLLWKLARYNDSELVADSVVSVPAPLTLDRQQPAESVVDQAITQLKNSDFSRHRIQSEIDFWRIDQAMQAVLTQNHKLPSSKVDQLLELAYPAVSDAHRPQLLTTPAQELFQVLDLSARIEGDVKPDQPLSLSVLEWHLLGQVMGARLGKELDDRPNRMLAVKCFREAIDLGFRNGELPHLPTIKRLANGLLAENQIDQASRYLTMAARLSPNDPEVQHRLGLVYIQAEDLAAATKHLRMAVDQAPDNPEYWATLGAAYLRAERAKEALNALDQAVGLGAVNADTMTNRAIALHLTGKLDQAIHMLKEVIAKFPSHTNATKLLQKLRRGEGN